MTKKTVAKSKATRTKRAAEKPVDAEIQRAAERAGVRPTPQAEEVGHVPPSNDGRELFPERMRRRLDEKDLSRLSALLTADLWTDDEQLGLQAETAICHVAAAQLKAIVMSLTGDSSNQGGDGWCLTQDEMTVADLVAALSGVSSMLRHGPKLVETLRNRGELRSSVARASLEEAQS
jgi:hypothetical protein